jgi:uncharacterized membrane protein
MNDITDQDRLLAAISYPIPIVAIVILVVEDMKNRPFQKYHAVQALAVGVILLILSILLSWTACLPFLLWFVTFYWAYKAYQGEYFQIPWLTNFLKGQGWL